MKGMKIFGKIIFVLAMVYFAGSGVMAGDSGYMADGPSLVFMLAGIVGLALMGFSLPEIGAAFRHAFGSTDGENEETLKISAYFWESTARGLLVLGVLGTAIGYIIVIKNNSSIANYNMGAAISFLTTLYGLVPAALCGVPALVLRKKVNGNILPTRREQGKPLPLRWETILGYALFIGTIAWSMSRQYDLFFHLPSLLVVVGLALALLALLGDAVAGHPVTLSFAFTGVIGVFIGIVKYLGGIAGVSIAAVVEGVTFSLLSCVFALLGMLLAGKPMEDRVFKAGINGKGTLLSRIAWYGFPILVLTLILFTQLMAMIPIHKG